MKHSWHSLPKEEVLRILGTSEQGISGDEANRRLKEYGENILPKEKPYSKVKLFLDQFNSPLVFLLIAVCGISFYLKHYSDAVFVAIVLIINTSVGFYQENKANASLQALRNVVRISARVTRGKNLKEIDSIELVPGDIVYLKAGDKVPADARIIKEQELHVNEAALTGEWLAVPKITDSLLEETPLADRANMVFMGTIVEEGSATVVVVETGLKTFIGGIVSLLEDTEERKTPLQKKIATLSKLVGLFVLLSIALIVLLGYLNGRSFAEIFVTSLALVVSAIPEGLLPAITIILVLGMRRIFKENGLVRKLIVTETLGSVTVICTDKTGTLTQAKMQVSHILTGTSELLRNGSEPLVNIKDTSLGAHVLALKGAMLCIDAFIENPDDEFHEWIVRGRPTERALLVAGTHSGLSKKELEEEYPRLNKINFNSEAKYSASLNQKPEGGKILYVLGAPEILSDRSRDFFVDGSKEALDSDVHKQLLSKLESLTEKGLRVVACAYREFAEDEVVEGALGKYVNNLTMIGYIALKDPLREDAKESIELTKRAGIRTILITGDHRLTARSIASEVGIEAADNMVIEGKDIDMISDKELVQKAKSIVIYARVSPEHKLRIVQALQSGDEVVAMVGDGVNDAPALKAADVGVAVGSGTDVAKEVADIVLLDDDFKTIVKAIEQGRIIFQNIRKVFVYLVTNDFSELLLFFAAMIFGLPLPLLAAQILWINLVEDGFPDIALTTEQEIEGVMDEKPRKIHEPIVNDQMKKWMVAVPIITGATAFILFVFLLKTSGDLGKTQSVIFALMCIDSLLFAFSVRSFNRSIFRRDIFSNRLLAGTVVFGLVLLFAAIYVPSLQQVLSTKPLLFNDWILIGVISAVEIVLIEWFKKRSFVPRLASV
ncbi:MAG: cation-translocating P-type ATPase [Minisyncoccota bacterium]